MYRTRVRDKLLVMMFVGVISSLFLLCSASVVCAWYWPNATSISTGTASIQNSKIVRDGEGNAIIAWNDTFDGISISKRAPGGGWSGQIVAMGTYGFYVHLGYDIDMNETGDNVIVSVNKNVNIRVVNE